MFKYFDVSMGYVNITKKGSVVEGGLKEGKRFNKSKKKKNKW